MNRVPKKIFDQLGKVNIPKVRHFFTIILAEQDIDEEDSFICKKSLKLSLEEMEKFLDSIPANENTQKVKKEIWEMFP